MRSAGEKIRMKKSFAFWTGHVIALALAAGMVLSLPFALAARDLGAVLFSRERVHSILQSRLIESGVLNRILVDTLFSGEAIQGGDDWYPRAVKHLSEPERQELLQMLIPSGWVEQQISNLSLSLFNWLESDQSVPDLDLDLQPIKARLLGESLDQAVEIFIDSWPSCSPEEVERLRLALEEGRELPSFVCEPPEPLRASLVDLATRALAKETQSIPDRVSPLAQSAVDHQQMNSTKATLIRLRTLLSVMWMLPAAALGLIMALKIRNGPDLGRWWGLPIFFAGTAALLLNLILRASRGDLLRGLEADLGAPGSVQYELAGTVLQGAVGQALGLMLVHALLIVLVGAGVWYLLARRGRDKSLVRFALDPGEEASSVHSVEKTGASQSPPSVPPLDSQAEAGQGGDEEGTPSGIFG